MKITVDTNVLIRAAVRDDRKQAQMAASLLKRADVIAVTLPTLCEFVWVLRKHYGYTKHDIIAAIQVLLSASNVRVNRPAVDAGLVVFSAGADFADAMIAHEGNWMGGESFASFDKEAVSVLTRQGLRAQLLH
jgi:predicted nucleic-acid-binding protein